MARVCPELLAGGNVLLCYGGPGSDGGQAWDQGWRALSVPRTGWTHQALHRVTVQLQTDPHQGPLEQHPTS